MWLCLGEGSHEGATWAGGEPLHLPAGGEGECDHAAVAQRRVTGTLILAGRVPYIVLQMEVNEWTRGREGFGFDQVITRSFPSHHLTAAAVGGNRGQEAHKRT